VSLSPSGMLLATGLVLATSHAPECMFQMKRAAITQWSSFRWLNLLGSIVDRNHAIVHDPLKVSEISYIPTRTFADNDEICL